MEPHPTPASPSPSLRSELELVTEDELSGLLKICKRQLYNMRMRGEIPYFKLGRSVRFRVGDVLEALDRMRIGAHFTHKAAERPL
jgi:excisionase family DNA binding protein